MTSSMPFLPFHGISLPYSMSCFKKLSGNDHSPPLYMGFAFQPSFPPIEP
jgi:hypothetical protein